MSTTAESPHTEKGPRVWRLKVGDLFAPDRTCWPSDSFELRYYNGNYLLQICESSPCACRIHAFRNGRMEIGLYVESNVIYFLFKIDGFWSWSDASFSIHLLSSSEQGSGSADGRFYVPLSLVLVDADTGKVAALRVLTMSPAFAQTFQSLIEDQRKIAFDSDTHTAAIKATYAKFPTPEAMARNAIIHERAGARH